MAKRKTIILGCGYLGSALTRALVSAGHDCVGTTGGDSPVQELRELGVKPVVLELAETSKLHDSLLDRETVFLTVAPGKSDRSYRDVYLAGAQSLLQAIEHTQVRHIVYTSSTGVYGQQDGSWVDEQSPTEPATENGRTLLETERCLLDGGEAASITVTILRLGGIYGPGRDPAKRIAQRAGQERSDGDRYVNMIHRRDVVSAMLALLDNSYGGVLNLTDDHPTTRREYYDRVIAGAALRPISWVTPDGPATLGKRVRNDLIKRALNLSLKHPTHC